MKLISIDPGESTGVVCLIAHPETQAVIHFVEQVEGGIHEFLENSHLLDFDWGPETILISERFTPRPMARSFKSVELEPLRIEGALIARGLMPSDYKDPRWRSPQKMILRKGDSPAATKKLSDNVLRALGLWHTGRQVGCKDANDVNSAMKHAVSYLLDTGHEPTLQALKEIIEADELYAEPPITM